VDIAGAERMSDLSILILDDDQGVLLPLMLLFRREGYRVLTATQAPEAFEQLQRGRVALVFSDQRLPGMSGVEFLKEVRRRWPDCIRILLTGYSDAATATAAINEGHVYRYLTKPWNEAELLGVVREAVRLYELTVENRRLYELTAAQALELRTLNQDLERKVAQRTEEIGVKNAELEDNLLNVIHLLTSVQQLRHSAMAGHGERMAEAARSVAEALGLEAAEQRNVEIAALLHDIGKLGLPDRVLHKDTYRLARDDQELMRQCPLLGDVLLSTIPRLKEAALIVHHQREWFNGHGYPDGLSGEDIPIGSRIIAVVEGYEEFNERDALLQGAGRRYDPRVVHEFLRYQEERRIAVAPGAELPMLPAELLEGMVLTRDLYSSRGLLLATRGKKIDRPTLEKIRNFHRIDPIPGKVYARA
jgi:response regulator RpfG family c-di-GMP phosphodiesterase